MKYPPDFKYSIQWPLVQLMIKEYNSTGITQETFEEYADRLYGLHIEYDTHGKNTMTLIDEKKFFFARLKFGA